MMKDFFVFVRFHLQDITPAVIVAVIAILGISGIVRISKAEYVLIPLLIIADLYGTWKHYQKDQSDFQSRFEEETGIKAEKKQKRNRNR